MNFGRSVSLEHLAIHWCSSLSPGVGIIDRLTVMIRGFMQPPDLEILTDIIHLFPRCPSLSIPRMFLSRELSLGLSDLFPLFDGYISDGTSYRYFKFSRNDEIAGSFDVCDWIESFLLCLVKSSSARDSWMITEVVRSSIMNALLFEPVPVKSRIVASNLMRQIEERKCWELDQPGSSSSSSRIAKKDLLSVRTSRLNVSFLQTLPRPVPPAIKSLDWNRHEYSEALEKKLDRVQKHDRFYERVMNIRRFLYRFMSVLIK